MTGTAACASSRACAEVIDERQEFRPERAHVHVLNMSDRNSDLCELMRMC